MKAAVFVCLIVALVLPCVASAQSEQPPPATSVASAATSPASPSEVVATTPPQQVVDRPPANSTHGLRIPITVWAASVATDQMTTYMFSSRYSGVLHERNFLIRGLDQHPAALVAAGTAIDVATGWVAYRLLRGHPRLAAAVFYSAAAYRSYLAVYNMRMMRRAQAITAAAPGGALR